MEVYAEGAAMDYNISNGQVFTSHQIELLNGTGTGHGGLYDAPRNRSHELPIPQFTEKNLIKIVVLSCMVVVSLIGNTATMVQMVRMRRRKSTINTLILHLAIADLIVTFFNLLLDAVWNYTVQWYGGDILCKLTKYLQVFGLYASTYILVTISLDRCLAILDPMSRNQAPQRVRIMVTVAWVLSAFFALPQMYIFRVRKGPFIEPFVQCVTEGAYTADWQEPAYTIVSLLLLFIIPLVTMSTAYLLIFCTIAKKSRDLQKESESANTEMLSQGPVRSQLFRKAKVKSLQMTALIVVAFIICWTPYYVHFFIYTFFEDVLMPDRYSIWIFFFGMGNSMVNPMIYGAFHVCSRRTRRNPRVKFNGMYRVGGTGNTGGGNGGGGGGGGGTGFRCCQASSGTGRGERAQGTSSHLAAGAGSSGASSSSRTPHHHINCCLGHANNGCSTEPFSPRQCCVENCHAHANNYGSNAEKKTNPAVRKQQEYNEITEEHDFSQDIQKA